MPAPGRAARTHLPAQPTRLVGRDPDVAALCERLRRPEVRLITLSGVGGAGKTRLAVAVAEQAERDFTDGARFIDLASVRDASQVEAVILRTLSADDPTAERGDLHARLRDASLLLVLDNFEHVTLAAPLVSDLLSDCRSLRIIATSRRPLRLRWEHEWPVAPLAPAAAIELFVDRATARDPSFRAEPERIERICERLDRLPLAIELAAARVKALTLDEILAGLGRPLALLTDGPADAPPRQHALRDAVAWSYELLSAEQRALFERLGVFLGGCDMDAIVAVAGAARDHAAKIIAALVDENLVVRAPLTLPAARFRMLEMVREFALERLAAAGAVDDARRAHAVYYLRLAEDLRPRLIGADEIAAYATLEIEHGNLHTALRYLLDTADAEHAARLALALSRYWHTHGTGADSERWLGEVRAVSGTLDDRTRAELLAVEASLMMSGGEATRAVRLYEDALSLARAVGDRPRAMNCLLNLAGLALDASDDAGARFRLDELRAMLDEQDDERARRPMVMMLGWIARLDGDLVRARALFNEHNAIARRMGSRRFEAHGLQALAEIEEIEGDRRSASALTRDALVMFRELGGRYCQAEALADAARIVAGRSADVAAAKLFGAAERAREIVGLSLRGREWELAKASIERIKGRLSERAFADAWHRGRELGNERAIDLALASIGAPSVEAVSTAAARPSAALTKRESEIAEHIARGLTNPQIARELVIGERTVDTHVENVLRKLDFTSRAQVAAWVTERRLRGIA